MQIRLSIFVFCFLLMSDVSSAATILPVGPIAFDSDADFQNNFKRDAQIGFTPIYRSPTGNLSMGFGAVGMSVYDTSSIGGADGFSGTSGNNANNDLSNFIISADLVGSFGSAAFYLRLDDNESGGYLARIEKIHSGAVNFSLWEGANLDSAGTQRFTQNVNLTNLMLSNTTYYPFAVTANGGKFEFDFANGAAKATFTDTSVTATIGQVGIMLSSSVFLPIARMDNFQIQAIPEPSLILAAVTFCALGSAWRMKKASRP